MTIVCRLLDHFVAVAMIASSWTAFPAVSAASTRPTTAGVATLHFQSVYDVPTTPHPNSFAVGDLNGDGVADLVVSGSAGLQVLTADSTLMFSETQHLGGAGAASPALGGGNGDGHVDLVFAQTSPSFAGWC